MLIVDGEADLVDREILRWVRARKTGRCSVAGPDRGRWEGPAAGLEVVAGPTWDR